MRFAVAVCLLFLSSFLRSSSAQSCNIDPYDRTDCKQSSEAACLQAGCCWNPTWSNGPAWCYNKGQASALPEGNTYVHLFEWSWKDIALECENFLGPNGFNAVQISPPQEHRIIYSNGERPWWERYQPVSYTLVSRSGNRAELADMIKRCNAVGVNVFADAVVNHMSGLLGQGQKETGTAGSTFSYYDYPSFKYNDFHHYPDYQGQGNCGINSADYKSNAFRVQHCDLSGLTDLDTGSAYVQSTIAAYLNDLVSLGVKGFRIDAAKHMSVEDLGNILKKVNNNTFIYQEVIDLGEEAVKYEDYLHLGSLCEFLYGSRLTSTFRSGKLASLNSWGEGWGLIKSNKAMSFLENHDNERGHGAGGDILMHEDGQLYVLANYFMLAHPYGYAQVMSSYRLRNTDHGPPSQAVWQNGRNTCFDSGSQWVCQHRWSGITSMVKFRAATRGEQVTNWWSNGGNQIAFGRGSKGFIVINRESFSLSTRLQTSMAPGVYCDVIKACATNVTVDASGYIQVNLPDRKSVV